ncbi:MAG: hypothetical protein IPH31_23730 [Lewinellaceae bacterium]|nr:hypothetical protein [Lewinellaceae bacterium]
MQRSIPCQVEDEQTNPSTFHYRGQRERYLLRRHGPDKRVLYKFKVRTRCGSDKSDWSDWVFFTAGNGGAGGSGHCASTLLSANVTGISATLSWNKVSGAVQYYIEVEDEQNGPSTFHFGIASARFIYTLVGLQAMFWHKSKSVHCTGGQSDWSGWLFFNSNVGGGTGGGNGIATLQTVTQVSNITAQYRLADLDCRAGCRLLLP